MTHKMIHLLFDTDAPLHSKNLYFHFIPSSITSYSTELHAVICNCIPAELAVIYEAFQHSTCIRLLYEMYCSSVPLFHSID